MSQIETGKLDSVQVCPQCMSTVIESTTMGVLTPGPDMRNKANCLSCGWTGKVGELAVIPFKNPFGDREATIEAFGRDVLMTVVRECAEPLGRVLIRWGMMGGQQIDKQQFTAYLTAISKAAVTAILQERTKQEKAAT